MALLEALSGSKPGKRYSLDRERAVLGRHPDCDIVLDQGAVSRQHAQIKLVDGDYFVEDLHSRNGTFVNGQAIASPHKLLDGDQVKICDVSFAFFREQPTLPLRGDGDTALAMFVDDPADGHSSIMSKLDIRSSATGVRLSVNPEAKLRALLEITQNFGKALHVDELLPKLLDSLFKIFVQADRGFVILKNDERLEVKAVKHRRAETDDTIRVSRTIVNQVLSTKEAILSADAASDMRFEMSQSIADFRIRSMMCAPLVNSEGEALGLIEIDTIDQRGRFQQEDLDVLASVASQAAFAIDNAQLHEAALRQQSIERDLELARKVQQGLLPAHPPHVEGYHFFDFYEPANQVGGDFYDFIKLPGGRWAVVLADVSGKGVSAALVMAKLSAEVRYCLASEESTATAVDRINAGFCQNGWSDRFVTMVLAVLDPVRHEVTFVIAGHMPPLVRFGTGRVAPVGGESAGVPLGVDGGFAYDSHTIKLEPGQYVTLYTDGISEAMNERHELYSIERLETCIGGRFDGPAMLGRAILDDVKRFVGEQSQSDDMCLVSFGRVEKALNETL